MVKLKVTGTSTCRGFEALATPATPASITDTGPWYVPFGMFDGGAITVKGSPVNAVARLVVSHEFPSVVLTFI